MVHRSAYAVAAIFAMCAFSSVPLHARDVRACQALEQRFAEIKREATSVERNNLLFSAAKLDCQPLAKSLLEEGASLEARDALGNMPLAKAAQNGRVELVKLFLEHKAAVNARNLEGSTALFLAAEEERYAVAAVLLGAGADPNIAGRTSITPVSAAAYTGNAELVKLLMDKGADANAVDATGKTAMMYAAGRGFTPVVATLIARGIDVNAAGDHALTPLMWAAGHTDEAGSADVKETLELLAQKGASLDQKDDRGMTALMIAAELGHTTAVETLIKLGADKTVVNKAGKTAAELAKDDTLKAFAPAN